MNKIASILIGVLLLLSNPILAQSQSTIPSVYPKVVGYMSFILPVVTINKDKVINDFSSFKNGFAIGFPIGLNVLYSDKFGFSFEITPTIQTGNGSSKTSKILIDPGPMFRFENGFTIITRVAFETSGRYGFTPVFNKIIANTNTLKYFTAASIPFRFGNSELPSIGGNLQFGIIFN
jgi:hypothetical protein